MLAGLLKRIDDFRLQRGFSKLKRKLKKFDVANNTEDIVDFLFSKNAALIEPWQFRSEITRLFKVYEKLNPRFIVEIGTANGGTLFGHCRLALEEATIISIDLPGGQYGGGYPEWKEPVYHCFSKKRQSLHLLRADSQNSSTVSEVKKILNGNRLDYLFIDGDHSYEGVKKDFELYSPLVKKSGVVVFHDIVPHKNSSCKVDVFWNEIKTQYKHQEFIDHAGQDHFGVGILFLE